MSYLTTENNDSSIGQSENFNEGSKADLILKMGLAELIIHATILLLLV